MPLQALDNTLPALLTGLSDHPALTGSGTLWPMLRRLLVAHAPSGGANLLGGIGDDIAVLADELGLRDRIRPQLGSTGNTAIWLGAEKPAADVVVVAHMDRPSFRVGALDNGTLYPICANRFPPGKHRVTAKAVRFEGGRLVVGAEGVIVTDSDQTALRFEVKQGALAWNDTVLMSVNPVHNEDGSVVGTGLDNSVGVLTTLVTAAVMRGIEDALQARDRRCLFVFTDQEEGPPDGFFGHGAARLVHAVPPPTYGCVIVDAHTAGHPNGPMRGSGTSHGVISGKGRGSVVPPNYHTLAVDLATRLNARRPGSVQLNNGYLSRSDDMILGRWTRVLALTGPPLSDPHTGHEITHLGDIQNGVWWLAYFLAAALNLAPELTPRYALGR
jgi:putative aminopeptidase FrvX